MGSGYGWLAYNKTSKCIEFRVTMNQDLLTDLQADLIPLLNVDVWEHAFYVDY